MDYSNLFVCLMGLATVFIGLICIIFLVSVMSSIVRKTDKASHASAQHAAISAPVPAALKGGSEITPEFIAAISAVIAEEMGRDVNAIRIVSVNKVG